MMKDNDTPKEPLCDQQRPPEPSPSEKLEGDRPTGSLIPGAQNPESEEIKGEVNPNTE